MSIMKKSLEEKKIGVDSTKPLSSSVKQSVDNFFKLEVSYHFATLEGNTLNRIESLLAIEQGMTTKGKTISEHIEVVNLANALDFVRKTVEVGPKMEFSAMLISIFDRLVDKLNEDLKGKFRTTPVRILGLNYIAPEGSQVPSLLTDLSSEIETLKDAKAPYLASLVHGEILRISPFPIANTKVARLMAQYILMSYGYPPMILLGTKRQDYLESLDEYLRFDRKDRHSKLILEACERGIDEYQKFFTSEANMSSSEPSTAKLLKIGDLARFSKESVATIRHWAKEGLLTASEYTPGGYMLFSETMINRVKEIRSLQKRGMSLSEIRGQGE